jgi:Cys-tRNA(Pro)/Cys-tRNA(Cys) deacylase
MREKTNAMRQLDQRRIGYESLLYDPGIHSATGVAKALDVPTQQVYKTLVMLRDRGRPLLMMVPGPAEVDPRLVAKSLGVKSVEMAPQREAERLTGLQVGGIGALALLNKPFDVLVDRGALQHDWILVNGGRRGVNLRIAVADLLAVTRATPVDAVAAGTGQ